MIFQYRHLLFFCLFIIFIIFISAIIYLVKHSQCSVDVAPSRSLQRQNGHVCMGSSNLIGHTLPYKKYSSGDPLIFGPIIWPALHIIAENYPENPDEDHKTNCYNFLKGLPYMLPCGNCGSHLLIEEQQKRNDVITDNKEQQLKVNLEHASKSRTTLRQFFLDAHNNVNTHNDKPTWTIDQVKAHYTSIPAYITNDKSWFDGNSV